MGGWIFATGGLTEMCEEGGAGKRAGWMDGGGDPMGWEMRGTLVLWMFNGWMDGWMDG